MKSRKKKAGLLRRILNRYKKIPRQLHSKRVSERSKAQKLITLTLCLPLMLYCLGYMGWYKLNQSRIERENARYSALYATPEPTGIPPVQSAIPSTTALPSSAPTASAPQITPEPATSAPLPTATSAPTAAPTMTAAPTDFVWEMKVSATPMPTFEIAADSTIYPYATPDADTLVLALETAAPVQESFSGLLQLNPETVGYLSVGQDISLPVVQRKNDNTFYLNHNFEGEESNAGTLFLDGSNLLAPEDSCLIVYGHNMKNGSMFHKLLEYESYAHLSQNPLIYFDTIYKNRVYAPFAVFSASMDAGGKNYIDIRRFDLDEYSFDPFIERMRSLSLLDIPVDVRYGDSVLLLVTCEYTYDNGRFVLALRALRDGESEKQLSNLVRSAVEK